MFSNPISKLSGAISCHCFYSRRKSDAEEKSFYMANAIYQSCCFVTRPVVKQAIIAGSGAIPYRSNRPATSEPGPPTGGRDSNTP